MVGRFSSEHRALSGVVAAGIVALTLGVGASVASAASGSTATDTVAQGINVAALPGASSFASTPPNTPETVSFILRARGLTQLKAQVIHGVRHDLTVPQFAADYGQSRRTISALTDYLAKFGITSTVYPDRLDVSTTGTAGEYDQALSVAQLQYHVPGVAGRNGMRSLPAQNVHGAAASPRVPARIAPAILAVLGLSNYSPFTSQTAHVNTSLAQPQASSSSSCVALSGLPDACNTAADFAKNYGLGSLYADGASGQGQTIGIVTLAAVDPGAPQYYWSNILHLPATGRSLTVQNIDGGPGAPSNTGGSGETDLDTEQSGGIAPNANVIIYQAPNTDPGFADAFFTAASQNLADSVSASWGESETYLQDAVAQGTETPAYQAAFDEAFLEFAAQGQSGFLSSGDSAAYDASGDLGTTNLSVDTNADSPYITSSGGTTTPLSATLTGNGGSASVSVPSQRIWGWDYLWAATAKSSAEPLAAAAEANVVGSGGGFSTLEPEPAYQREVSGTSSFTAVPYLTPTTYKNVGGLSLPTAWSFDAAPALTQGAGSGRVEPDLAADADPYSGYLLYAPSFAQAKQPVLEGGWGGTSFVAPQLNGSTAVIDSYLGHRVGFWNPTLYAAAAGGSSPLTPLDQSSTSNDNIYYTGTPGTEYNPGAGLGYPNLSALASDFGAPGALSR